jgi:glycerate dehydrogenase
MRAVFLDSKTFAPEISFTALTKILTTLTCYDFTQPEQVLDRCKNADIIICNKVILSKALLTQLPNVKLICVTATGTNNIDMAAANTLNIKVCNVTNYAQNSVAQYVFAQLLNFFQHIEQHNQAVREGQWQKSTSFCLHGMPIHQLADKKLAIIGYGGLGQAVAKIATAFNMQVLISERKGATSIRNNRVSFNEAISKADIITLHCPQTEETEQLIDSTTLSMCQPHCLLVNTARGALIDDHALISALKNKQLGGAILDVLNQEPPPANHPLLTEKLDNLIITGHIAWASIEAQQQLIELVANNINQFLQNNILQ